MDNQIDEAKQNTENSESKEPKLKHQEKKDDTVQESEKPDSTVSAEPEFKHQKRKDDTVLEPKKLTAQSVQNQSNHN